MSSTLILKSFFDKIPFHTLLDAMNKLGFTNNMIKFFHTYLINREMRVKYGNSISKPVIPPSGIPQGNKLSTLFAIIVINSITDELKYSESLIFADDFKIFKKISCPQDCIHLQKDLDTSQEWARKNGLSFNTDKCEQMSFIRGGKNFKHQHQYTLLNKNLINVDEKKRFRHHISIRW